MSNDQSTAKQAASVQPKKADSIPVRNLYFTGNRLLPNGQRSDVAQGGDIQGNKARFVIDYMTGLQMFRIAYYEPSAPAPKKVMLYPREWASCEPVPM